MDKINHCITLRHGGVSTDDSLSLNFRFEAEENKENVIKNLDLISKAIGVDSKNVYKGKQDHTDNILVIDNNNKKGFEFSKRNQQEYDGYICSNKNIATLVTTADCSPVIIYDPINNVIANVHSGWKGTIKKIYIKALKIMREKYNTSYENVIVCVGPAVQKCCFSSTEQEFKDKFLSVWNNEKEYIEYEKEEKDRFHIDLTYVIKKDLINLGVKKENIAISNICTCCNHEDFFSYRYKTKTGMQNYGTMATIVELI